MKQNPISMNSNSPSQPCQNSYCISLTRQRHRFKCCRHAADLKQLTQTNSCFILPPKGINNNNNMSGDPRCRAEPRRVRCKTRGFGCRTSSSWQTADRDPAVLKPLWGLSLETNRAWPTAAPWPVLFKACLIHFSFTRSHLSVWAPPSVLPHRSSVSSHS